MNMMNFYSKIVSGILSPFLIPTYIYAVLIYCANISILPFFPYLSIVGTVLIITAIIPYISILWNKYNTEENDKYRDIYSYLNIGVCYIIAIYTLFKFGLPLWMISFMFSGIVLIIMVAILKRSFNISTHLTAYGAYIGALFVATKFYNNISIDFIAISVLAGGLLGSSRAYLKDHSPGEFIMSVILGFVWSYFIAIFVNLVL